jgi:hypothetical protein
MTTTKPNLQQKAKLYQAAIKVKKMAPWQWLYEADVFCLQHPKARQLGFVSVMGNLGEHLAVALYLGAEGLNGFWRMNEGLSDVAEEVLQVPHLQASFEDRSTLTQKDRDEIKALGLKFRGRQAWPLFRSYRPGFFPWYLEPDETQFLTWALEQVLVMAPRIREDRNLVWPEDQALYMGRVARRGKKGWVWRDKMIKAPAYDPPPLIFSVDEGTLIWLESLPHSDTRLEMDLVMLPARIGKPGERPRVAYMLLIVDSESGIVLGSDVLAAEEGLEDMHAEIPDTIVESLANLALVPTEIWVRSHVLLIMLAPLAEVLGFELDWQPVLPNLDPAVEFMTQRFG